MATSGEPLQSALAHHQAGRIRDAEAIYRQILQVNPRHVDALHLLGLVAHQSGQHDAAIRLISQAIALRGDQAVFHSNLGEAYRGCGKPGEAIPCYQQALRLNPAYPEAHNNLGNALQSLGQLAEAEAAYREAIRLRQNYPEPFNNLGMVRQRCGDLAGAVANFRQALQVSPNFVSAWINLGAALGAQGDHAGAAECYRTTLALQPANSELRRSIGLLHQRQRQLPEAIAFYREALRLDPRSALAHNELGTALQESGLVDQAMASYREALLHDPHLATAHANLAVVLQKLGRLAEAAQSWIEAAGRAPGDVEILWGYGLLLEQVGNYDEALKVFRQTTQLRPDFARGHFSQGNVYQILHCPDEALACFQAALRADPRYPEAYNNLASLLCSVGRPDQALELIDRGLELAPGLAPLYANKQVALHAQGRPDEAVAACRHAMELSPHDAAEHSNYLYTLNFHPGYDAPALFGEHLAWAQRFAEPLTAQAPSHANEPLPNRRLRVGYVSPYFRQHAVNYFVEPILAAHDHREFEIYAYADLARPDATTTRLQAVVDHWCVTRFMSDEQIAGRVREDRIDILVDLTGHIGGNRMLTFARKPAPIQVTYIGYQNTTGMTAMDYRLTDEQADPPGTTDAFYTERLVRLPRAYFCYRPSDDAPAVTPLPALTRAQVTFGSFNNFAKVTPQVIDAWWRILARVPGSRLMVLAYQGGSLEKRLKSEAQAHGIDPARIELQAKRPRIDYLKLIAEADIALDPFPFNGHTTTCDAIWQGVPVVMLRGSSYVSRFGGSVLANVALEALMADSVDGYVDAAVGLAADLPRLAALRQGLRATMADSALLDYAGFTRSLEQAYRHMWHAWCDRSRKPPD